MTNWIIPGFASSWLFIRFQVFHTILFTSLTLSKEPSLEFGQKIIAFIAKFSDNLLTILDSRTIKKQMATVKIIGIFRRQIIILFVCLDSCNSTRSTVSQTTPGIPSQPSSSRPEDTSTRASTKQVITSLLIFIGWWIERGK